MEMHATTVIRGDDGHLTIYDKTQGSQNSRWVVSRVFGLSKDKVTVRNPFVGGAFGSGLRPQYQLLLAVMAALQLRALGAGGADAPADVHLRPPARDLAARAAWPPSRDGTLQRRHPRGHRRDLAVRGLRRGGRQLVRAAVPLRQRPARLPAGRPRPATARSTCARPAPRTACTRSKWRWTSWRTRCGMDPLALRLKNYAERDPRRTCRSPPRSCAPATRRARSASAGQRRDPQPRSMREGRELVGWGMATGTWDAMQMFARAQRGAARRRPPRGEQRGQRHRHRHLHRDGADRRRRAWACRWSR